MKAYLVKMFNQKDQPKLVQTNVYFESREDALEFIAAKKDAKVLLTNPIHTAVPEDALNEVYSPGEWRD